MKKADLVLSELPDAPGVYQFVRGTEVLYVGKATSLRSRVRSYFDPDLAVKRSPVVEKAVSDATGVRTLVTDSVLEALLLEARLIKELQPYGNKLEKDDKSFNYVVITKEEYPRIVVARGRELAACFAPKSRKYVFGPFTQGASLREALKIIRRIFPYFDERSRQDKTIAFNQSIGIYPTYDKASYQKTIRNIALLFEGKKKALLTGLERQMRAAAKAERFEEANAVKRQLFALTHLRDTSLLKDEYRTSHTVGYRIEAYDTAHFGGDATRAVMVVVEDGVPATHAYRVFNIRHRMSNVGDDFAALREVLERRLAHPEWPYPKLIVIDGGHAHLRAARDVISTSDVTIEVCAVVKDERHKAREIIGKKSLTTAHAPSILLANHEAHRFSISRHRKALRVKKLA